MAGIFISYRRDDSAPYAGRLHDHLTATFAEDQVFMDIDDIDPGEDFVEAINLKLESCAVVVALIGKNWLTCVDSTGTRRLENPDDYVRRELSRALVRKIRVIPVLVGHANMPLSSSLPAELAPLAYRNALEISDTRFHQDVDRLVQALRKVLAPSADPPRPAMEATLQPAVFPDSRQSEKKERHRQQVSPVSPRSSPVSSTHSAEPKSRSSSLDAARQDGGRKLHSRITISCAIVAALLLILYGVLPKTKRGNISIPNVVGKQIEEARQVIAAAGLAVGQESKLEDNALPGTVLEQTPKAGETGPARSSVDLVMASARRVRVPRVVGESTEAGTKLLAQQGLVVGKTELKVSPDKLAGTILSQHPEPDAPATKGDAVNLDIAVRPSLMLVDLRGSPLEQAKNVLSTSGLALGTIEYQKTTEAEPGSILGQRPEPGENVEHGTRIDVVVAVRPEVEAPSLAKMTLSTAQAALERVGLKLGTVKTAGLATSSDVTEPIVRGQIPAAGARLRPGTPVDIMVAAPGVRIPEVAKMPLRDARIALERAGLTIGDVTERPVVAIEAGQVLETHGAGGWVAKGSRVDLVVAGKMPLLQVSTYRPGELRFDPRQVGKWETQPIKLQNRSNLEHGRAAPTIRSMAITGDQSADFKITSATRQETPCPGTPFKLDNDCTVRVIFTPIGVGTRTASLMIISDAEGSPHRIGLGGSGTPALGSSTERSETVSKRRKPSEQIGANPEAMDYFRQAQTAGNFTEALPLYRRAAELGHAEAQYIVGSSYARPPRGVPRDDGLAVGWFRRAAQQGHTKAQSSLALMYREGRGVVTDYAEALKWYSAAANAGDAGGQYGMALMYSNGLGVPKDEGIGIMWFRKAAAQGDSPAQEELKRRKLGW